MNKIKKIHASRRQMLATHPIQGYGCTLYSKTEKATQQLNGWWKVEEIGLVKGTPFLKQRQAL